MIYRDANTLYKISVDVGNVTAIQPQEESLNILGYINKIMIKRFGLNQIILLDNVNRFLSGIELPNSGAWSLNINSNILGNDLNYLEARFYAASDKNNFIFPINVQDSDMNTYAGFVRKYLPENALGIPSFNNQFKNLIIDATKSHYVSLSNKDAIPTGNNYQTLDLGDTFRLGGRPSREKFLSRINFKSKSVIDLGANTGENSRIVRKFGADFVDGYEYDPFFVEIGRAVNAVTGMTRVSLFQGRLHKTRVVQ